MTLGQDQGAHDGVPETNKGLLVAAGVLLAIPLIALLWVSTYAKETPRLWGFPFFFWYQFLWVFITAAMTYAAHRLVIAARGGSQRGSRRTPEQGADR